MSVLRRIHRFDETAFIWFMKSSYAHKTARISRWVSRTGDGPLYVLLGVMLVLYDVNNGQDFVSAALIAFAIELPIYLLVKNAIRRNRPHEAIQGFNAFLKKPSDRFSFPSGHTAGGFLMATLIAHYYPEFAIFAYIVATMVGCSRVFLGVHFPTDILAGVVLGVSSAIISLSMMGAL